MELFSIFLYFYYKLCHYRSTKKPIEYMICFIYSKQCITIILLRKMCGFISSVFKRIVPNNTTPTYQEVGGGTSTHSKTHFAHGKILRVIFPFSGL